jgi:hypothetical protein
MGWMEDNRRREINARAKFARKQNRSRGKQFCVDYFKFTPILITIVGLALLHPHHAPVAAFLFSLVHIS